MAKYSVLIPCAGSGSRFASPLAKQYHELCGKTVLDWCLEVFNSLEIIEQIVLVANPGDEVILEYADRYAKVKICRVGGQTRAESVLNGLRELNCAANDWVLVHDAARCCLRSEDVLSLIEHLASSEIGGILAQKAIDTVKQVNSQLEITQTLDRNQIYLAQTPQMFRYSLLLKALSNADPATTTDEASAIEQLGLMPQIVECGSHNFKITYPEDLSRAEILLSQRVKGGK